MEKTKQQLQNSIEGSIGKAIKNGIAFDIIGFTSNNELYINLIDGGRSVPFDKFDKIIWFEEYE